MKKLLFVLIFVFLLSFISAEEIQCNGSGNIYTGTFTSNQYCIIPVLEGKGEIKVELNEAVFRSDGYYNFPFSVYFSIKPEFDPAGLLKEDKLDCGPYGTDNWIIQREQGSDLTFGSNDFPKETVCDTQRGMFRKDVDLVALTVPVQPSSKNINLEINLKASTAFKEYLSLKLGKTVNEVDLRNLSMQFSVFEEDNAGKIKTISQGDLKTEFEIHLAEKIGKGSSNALFYVMKEDKIFCEVSVSFDSAMNPMQCSSIGKASILFDEKETAKYTEDKDKGKELFFNLNLKIEDIDAVVSEHESKPEEKPEVFSLSELQKQINDSVLSEYNRIMGVKQ